jgi:diacylglycerol kinase (ATP)
VRTIDTGMVTTADGQRRTFINIVTLGFSADVVRTAQRRFGYLGSRSYMAAVLVELINLKHLPANIITRNDHYCGSFTLLAACNTGYTGGGMWMAPMADAADGMLDFVAARNMRSLELLRLFPRIFNGRHLSHPAVIYERSASIEIESPSAWFVCDGDLLQGSVKSVHTVPASLHVIL